MTKIMTGVVPGSASELEVMRHAVEQPGNFGIPYAAKVASAHRTLGRFFEYAGQAEPQGFICIIASLFAVIPLVLYDTQLAQCLQALHRTRTEAAMGLNLLQPA